MDYLLTRVELMIFLVEKVKEDIPDTIGLFRNNNKRPDGVTSIA
jgi:hypothetical protein